jgi:hypothetical protein
MAKEPSTVLRLSRPIDADGRSVDSIGFVGAPGSEALPVNENAGEYEFDVLAMLNVMSRRTGLSRPAIEKLSPVDLVALSLTLFAPARARAQKQKH